MEVEKRSSKGGFLQLFDWNAKSRKKLFSNRSDVPESSKQGKENMDNMAISRLHQMNLHESMHGPTVSDWGSSVSNDEGNGTKAPGVVARLMGLDSLPTLDASDPGYISSMDSHSFRQSWMTTEFETEHRFADYNMRNKLDGFSRNPVEDRLQKLQNRPIERFQTEVLPPRSAKPVPITHNRMLSPIKSPGFILSRNAAYIMETASKIIEQSPQSTLNGRVPSFTSVPLKIRDLKEKMEAAQKASKLPEASQRPKACSPVSSSKKQPREKRQCGSEIVVLQQGVAGSLKQKNKSVSVSTPAKTNIQKLEGTTSRNRSTTKQKEDGVRFDKKQRTIPKRPHNSSTTGKNREVLTQNNQKQNCASHKDRTHLKPPIPHQHDRKTTSINGVKTSKKAGENSAVGTKKAQFATSETRKEASVTAKNFSGRKRPTDGNIATNNVLIKEKERSVKCNITIDGSSNWESVDRKNGIDVVSFTFTSPIKKPTSESDTSGQSAVKRRGVCLKFEDDNTGTSDVPSFGTPLIDSDALSILLEQKLKELSSLVETPQCDNVSSASAKDDKMFHLDMHKDKNVISHDPGVSLVDQMLVNAKREWQGDEMTECDSNSENYENGTKHEYQHPCTSPSLEASLSDDSCITSNSTATLTSNGNKQYISARNMKLWAEEIELQDSATSFPTTIFESNPQWELEYIREIVNCAELFLEDFALSQTQYVINVNLFDQLENQNKNMNPLLKPHRKALFECVSMCMEGRCTRAFSGSYNEWSKWSTLFRKKELLADEIQKEICGWINMEDLMVDEVVDKDMSIGIGKWLDFEAEALEEGVVIENDLLNVLIDEIVDDFLSC